MARILVVDDVKLFRHLEATVLGWRGHMIDEASSGEEALEKIKTEPPDLVLLDLNMPGMDGHAVCRHLKEDPSLHSLPVIMVTSSNRDEDIRQAVQAGCDDYLTKPIDEADLVRKVEDLLGSARKRRFPRVPASMQVSFEDFKGIFFEYSRDLSRSGVFIEMSEPLPVGTRLRLSFSLPPPFNDPVMAYGRVVRIAASGDAGPGGVGVAFIHVDPESLRTIDAMVAGQAPEPDSAFGHLSVQLAEEHAERRRDADSAADEEPRESVDELRRDHLRLSARLAMHESLASAASPKEVLRAASDILVNLVGVESFAVLIHDLQRGLLVPVLKTRLPGLTGEHLSGIEAIERALAESRLQIPSPPCNLAGLGGNLMAVVPFLAPGGQSPLGLITIHGLYEQKQALTVADNHLLESLGQHLGPVLASALAVQRAGTIEVSAYLEALS
ncbi:MAG: response regulator [Deltaproteobacteria bacterium]|nr:response regulator [Deltaproteobacteria bacterium]